MFTISGIPSYPGAPLERQQLTWIPGGAIAGPPDLLDAARVLETAMEGKIVGPPDGPITSSNHLRSGVSAVFLLRELFLPDTIEFSGDVPRRRALPKGAIG